jgi:hypothetical protein
MPVAYELFPLTSSIPFRGAAANKNMADLEPEIPPLQRPTECGRKKRCGEDLLLAVLVNEMIFLNLP